MSISKQEILQGRDLEYPNDYTPEISKNIDNLLVAMTQIRSQYNHIMIINSGWRPPSINSSVPGAAKNSKHLIGLACDLNDPDGSLWQWVLNNLDLMQKLGIYFEDKRGTPSWVHFQLGPPSSNKRIFIPNTSPPSDSSLWNGKYDSKFDGELP